MSRTRKGSKGPGYEYWGSRYSPGAIEDPGRFTKILTHRRERRRAKRDVEIKLDHTMEFHELDKGYSYDWVDFE